MYGRSSLCADALSGATIIAMSANLKILFIIVAVFLLCLQFYAFEIKETNGATLFCGFLTPFVCLPAYFNIIKYSVIAGLK